MTLKFYDPRQPRDASGRWTKGGQSYRAAKKLVKSLKKRTIDKLEVSPADARGAREQKKSNIKKSLAIVAGLGLAGLAAGAGYELYKQSPKGPNLPPSASEDGPPAGGAIVGGIDNPLSHLTTKGNKKPSPTGTASVTAPAGKSNKGPQITKDDEPDEPDDEFTPGDRSNSQSAREQAKAQRAHEKQVRANLRELKKQAEATFGGKATSFKAEGIKGPKIRKDDEGHIHVESEVSTTAPSGSLVKMDVPHGAAKGALFLAREVGGLKSITVERDQDGTPVATVVDFSSRELSKRGRQARNHIRAAARDLGWKVSDLGADGTEHENRVGAVFQIRFDHKSEQAKALEASSTHNLQDKAFKKLINNLKAHIKDRPLEDYPKSDGEIGSRNIERSLGNSGQRAAGIVQNPRARTNTKNDQPTLQLDNKEVQELFGVSEIKPLKTSDIGEERVVEGVRVVNINGYDVPKSVGLVVHDLAQLGLKIQSIDSGVDRVVADKSVRNKEGEIVQDSVSAGKIVIDTRSIRPPEKRAAIIKHIQNAAAHAGGIAPDPVDIIKEENGKKIIRRGMLLITFPPPKNLEAQNKEEKAQLEADYKKALEAYEEATKAYEKKKKKWEDKHGTVYGEDPPKKPQKPAALRRTRHSTRRAFKAMGVTQKWAAFHSAMLGKPYDPEKGDDMLIGLSDRPYMLYFP